MTVDEVVQTIVEIYENNNTEIRPRRFFEIEVHDFLSSRILMPAFKKIDFKKIEEKAVSELPSACPKTGEFYGYKVGDISKWSDKYYTPVLIKLKIPADAKRVGIYFKEEDFHKCRCSYAYVEDIYDFYDKDTKLKEAHSLLKHTLTFDYKVGEKVVPDSYDECPFCECSNGIHFFMTEDEAIKFYGNCSHIK